MTDKERSQRALVVNWPDWLPPLIDFLLIVAAFVLGHYVRYTLQLLRPVFEANRAPFEPFVPYVLIFAVWVILSVQQQGLYRHRRGRSWSDEVVSIGNATMQGLVVVMALSFFLQPLVFSRLLLLYGGVFSGAFLALARLGYRNLRRRQRQRGIGVERVLVVGAGEIGRAVMRNMLARPDLGFVPVGFVDEDPLRSTADIGRLKALGKTEQLAGIVEAEQIDMVIVTLSWEHHREILRIMRECAR
ncbi:MAG: hypothetical protein JW910_14305, partial [Anaerolineae bacterium]|nr:hypothetical protein [Anaerolineae bacterium]